MLNKKTKTRKVRVKGERFKFFATVEGYLGEDSKEPTSQLWRGQRQRKGLKLGCTSLIGDLRVPVWQPEKGAWSLPLQTTVDPGLSPGAPEVGPQWSPGSPGPERAPLSLCPCRRPTPRRKRETDGHRPNAPHTPEHSRKPRPAVACPPLALSDLPEGGPGLPVPAAACVWPRAVTEHSARHQALCPHLWPSDACCHLQPPRPAEHVLRGVCPPTRGPRSAVMKAGARVQSHKPAE